MGFLDPSHATVQALIVFPTRELGFQIARVAKRLASRFMTRNKDEDDDESVVVKKRKKILIMTILQGASSQQKQQRAWAWAKPPHVIIGTPQELTNMNQKSGMVARENTKEDTSCTIPWQTRAKGSHYISINV